MTLDPARACFHAAKSCREIIAFQRMGVYNRNGWRPKSEISGRSSPQRDVRLRVGSARRSGMSRATTCDQWFGF